MSRRWTYIVFNRMKSQVGELKCVSYSAEFAGKDEDASLKQRAGIELQQVAHIDCHDQLRQVPLGKPQTHAYRSDWARWTELNPGSSLVLHTHIFRDGRETSGVWSNEVWNLVDTREKRRNDTIIRNWGSLLDVLAFCWLQHHTDIRITGYRIRLMVSF